MRVIDGWKVSRRLLWLLAVAGSAACFCGPEGPSPDSCDDPSSAQLDGLELGSISSELYSADRVFFPQAESDSIFIVRGRQGGDMIGLRFATRGGGDPDCLQFKVEVKQGGAGLATRDAALATYRREGGRVTDTLWIPASYGAGPLEVTASAGGQRRTVTLTPVTQESCEAASACPCAVRQECLSGPSDDGCREGLSARAREQFDAARTCAVMRCASVDGGSAADAGVQDGGAGVFCDFACEDCRRRALSTYGCEGRVEGSCGTCAEAAYICGLSPP